MKRLDQMTFGKKLALVGGLIVLFNLIALLMLWYFLDAESYVEKFREAYSYIEHPNEDWDDGHERRAAEATLRIKKNPRDARAYAKRGEANYWLSKYDQALEDFDQAIKLGTAKAEWYNRRGYLYDRLDKHDLAFRDFSLAIEMEPANGDYYESRAEHLADLEKYDQALLDYDRALKHSNQKGKVLIERAEVYKGLNRLQDAIRDLDQAIALNESYYGTQAIEARAEIHLDLKQYESALEDYGLWIDRAPKSSAPLEKRADLLEKLDRKDEARKDLEAAVVLISNDLNDDSWAYRFDERGDIYKRLGKIDRARADWRKALELYESEKMESYTFSTMQEICRKLDDQACKDKVCRLQIAFVSKQIAADPCDPSHFHERGLAYEAIDDYDNAVKDFSEAIRISPSSSDYFRHRATVMVKKKQYGSAIDDYQKAVSRDRKNEAAQAGLVEALERAGRHKEAIVAGNQALVMVPEAEDVYFWLAKAEKSLGLKDKAIEHTRRYSELESANENDDEYDHQE